MRGAKVAAISVGVLAALTAGHIVHSQLRTKYVSENMNNYWASI